MRQEPEEESKQVQIDPEAFQTVASDFRLSYRMFLDDCKALLDSVSEANKQVATFYERLMLIALGTIGLSVTALASYLPKSSFIGISRYIAIALVSAAWFLLLSSSSLCRLIIVDSIKANKSLIEEWQRQISNFHRQALGMSASRMSSAATGFVRVGDSLVDVTSIFSMISNLVNPKTLQDKIEEFKKVMNKENIDSQPAAVKNAAKAIWRLRLGLIMLAIVAIIGLLH